MPISTLEKQQSTQKQLVIVDKHNNNMPEYIHHQFSIDKETMRRKRQSNNQEDEEEKEDGNDEDSRVATSSYGVECHRGRRHEKKKKKPKLDPINDKIVIVGAGLAGLSTCLALENSGFQNITLYERDGDFDAQREGYGLTLTYNPKGPLAKLGLLETVAQHDCPSRSHYIFLQPPPSSSSSSSAAAAAAVSSPHEHEQEQINDAVPIGYFGSAFYDSSSFSPGASSDCLDRAARGRGQRGNLRVPRKVLRRILLDSLKTTKVRWGHHLIDFEFGQDLGNTDSRVGKYRLVFNDSSSGQDVVDHADFLVGADGVRSRILKKLYNLDTDCSGPSGPSPSNTAMNKHLPTRPMPSFVQSLSIRLILGIAEFDHPLLTERGFYTLDVRNGIRLFTMPYFSNRFDDNDKQKRRKNRVMWQLSFPASKIQPEEQDQSFSSRSLHQHAMDMCKYWHSPVLEMIQSTPLETVWGTELMDRNPHDVLKIIQKYNQCNSDKSQDESNSRLASRLAIVGDALHPMSCFKGQGANQALADGPLLAKWLQQSSIEAAWKGWWRETVARVAPIVQASRTAAHDLHNIREITRRSDEIILKEEYHDFAGVQPDRIPALVQILRDEHVGPRLGSNLDESIRQIIEKNSFFVDNELPTPSAESSEMTTALSFSSDGYTEGLRKMSLDKQNRAILEAREDGTGRDCLHVAAINGHVHTCKWLLTELRMPASIDHGARTDSKGKSALDYAMCSGNGKLKDLFSLIVKEEKTN